MSITSQNNAHFIVAESNKTLLSVEEENFHSVVASMIAYVIFFGLSVMVRAFFGLEEEDTSENLLFIWEQM